MYVCGPTVYGEPHLGHGRFALVFDVLRRYLEFSGLTVHHVSNITDVDDKIIARAASEGVTEVDIAARYEKSWWDAMDALGVLRPAEAPHATDYVEDMVEAVAGMLASGSAYETSDGVYLSVDAVEGYGLLARQPLDTLRAGARVEAGGEKRSPMDFALWKRAKPGEPVWPAPFGEGRPGWHTECVVMSLDLLGEGFDIHGGGIDLAFPHHENERAQASALGRPLARHWVHNGWVTVGGEKMAKSLGNYTSLDDLLARSDPRSYRLLVLRSHYRQPLEVTVRTTKDAAEALGRLDALSRRFGAAGWLEGEVRQRAGVDQKAAGELGLDAAAIASFCSRMDDDLDTPAALAGVFEVVRQAHVAGDRGETQRGEQLAHTADWLCAALGLRLEAGAGGAWVPVRGGAEAAGGGAHAGEVGTERGTEASTYGSGPDEEVLALVEERDRARAERDWSRADALRDELAVAGWTVEDTPQGTKIRRT